MNHQWISVEDKLPGDKETVLVYLCQYLTNKSRNGQRVVTFRQGVTREVAKKRHWHVSEDQMGNNERPYGWRGPGPFNEFGQNVSHWMPLPNPPKDQV